MTVDTILVSLIIGIVAGWLAGEVWRGEGFGLVGNLIVGIVGSLVGAFVINAVEPGIGGMFGTLIMSFAGAMILLFAAQLAARATRIA